MKKRAMSVLALLFVSIAVLGDDAKASSEALAELYRSEIIVTAKQDEVVTIVMERLSAIHKQDPATGDWHYVGYTDAEEMKEPSSR